MLSMTARQEVTPRSTWAEGRRGKGGSETSRGRSVVTDGSRSSVSSSRILLLFVRRFVTAEVRYFRPWSGLERAGRGRWLPRPGSLRVAPSWLTWACDPQLLYAQVPDLVVSGFMAHVFRSHMVVWVSGVGGSSGFPFTLRPILISHHPPAP